MVHDAHKKGGRLTIGTDSRITRIGHVLRRLKLDELPQLLNILKGDMSMVGPRPEVAHYVEMFREEYQDVLTVRPGLTDLASLKYLDEQTMLGAMHILTRHTHHMTCGMNREFAGRRNPALGEDEGCGFLRCCCFWAFSI